MNGELPNGWVWTSLGNIIKIQGGYAFKSKDYQKEGIPLLRITNIANGKIIFNGKENVYLPNDYILPLDTYIVKKNDILIALSGVNTGKTGIYELEYPSLLNQRVGRVQLLDKLSSNKFILYYLEYIREEVLKKTYGAAQPNISTLQLENMGIPLPPLAEQQRIVNKIEELFTNLDKGVESLEEVKSKLKVYRQAILKYAMEGKLTEKWREENKDKIEPASVLLEKIEKEKNVAKSYSNKDFDKKELPENWIKVKVMDILEVIRGASPRPKGDPKYFGGSIPWIMISDISKEKGKYISKTKDTVNEEGAKKSRYLKKGTLILSNSGTVCIPKILNVDGCIHDGFVAFPNFNENLDMLFFYYYFYYIRPRVIQENKQGVTQVNLNTNIIKNIQIFLPPLEEQKVIVERIEKLFSLADHIEETVDSKLEESKTLRQSILKKAFEGKLVPQDPNDESAETLLEKIKMEKSNKGKAIQEKLI